MGGGGGGATNTGKMGDAEPLGDTGDIGVAAPVETGTGGFGEGLGLGETEA